MSRRGSHTRDAYEFSETTKRLGLKVCERSCESCGLEHHQTSLQAHHILGINYAITHYPFLTNIVIRSLANLKYLCPNCHETTHKADDASEVMDDQAVYLWSLQFLLQYKSTSKYDQLIAEERFRHKPTSRSQYDEPDQSWSLDNQTSAV